MPRRHLIEINDQPWCPTGLRDGATNLLEFFIRTWRVYDPIVPRLAEAIRRSGATEVVDLCSGRGGPWLGLVGKFAARAPERVWLTDKFPNVTSDETTVLETSGRVARRRESIDAMAVPAAMRGFRTLFTAFHHFRPDDARAILADAVRNRVGIGVFEFNERRPIPMLALCTTPLAILCLVPLLRPFRWSNLLYTYLLPLLPLMGLCDGLVSCVRTYSPAELEALIAPLRSADYVWDIGQERTLGPLAHVTYLIGYPKPGTGAEPA